MPSLLPPPPPPSSTKLAAGVDEPEKLPFSRAKLAYLMAIAFGAIAAPIGLLASPLALYLANLKGKFINKDGNKVTPVALWLAIGIVAVPSLWIFNAITFPSKEAEKDKVKAAKPVQNIQKWVERHEIRRRWTCEDAIKQKLKDPKSMETRKVTYQDAQASEGSTAFRALVVVMFGARNSFGGMTIGTGFCTFDSQANLQSFDLVE